MTTQPLSVNNVKELVAAVGNASIQHIMVSKTITDVPSLQLAPGQFLVGAEEGITLHFIKGVDGVCMTTDTFLGGIKLEVSPEKRAVFNDTTPENLGTLKIEDLIVIGQVQILVKDNVKIANIEVDGLDIIAADTRGQKEMPHAYGVYVIQGAFTLWNMQNDASVVVKASLLGLSAGRRNAPVIGSGILVSGHGDATGGSVNVDALETEAIYSCGNIPAGTPNMITGGVFNACGSRIGTVHNLGPVETYGVNDMVLDNWGVVDRWTAEARLTSYGPSGIGFVNFGILQRLVVNAPIETFGQGARGFNVYAGSIAHAEFDRITTRADGAVGVQISQPIGRLVIHRGIETFGGTGDSLVKGIVTQLSAIALSVKQGGSIRELCIGDSITTHGKDIAPLEIHGAITRFKIKGDITAVGGNYDSISI